MEGEHPVLVLVEQHEHLLEVRHQLLREVPILLETFIIATFLTQRRRHYQVDVDDELVLVPHHALLALHLPHPHRVDPRPRGAGRPSAPGALLQSVLVSRSEWYPHDHFMSLQNIALC